MASCGHGTAWHGLTCCCLRLRALCCPQRSLEGWEDFVDDMRKFYQVDLSVLNQAYRWVAGPSAVT